VKVLKQEVDRLNKVNLVVVAAKVSYENLAKEHMSKSLSFYHHCDAQRDVINSKKYHSCYQDARLARRN
jgi:hypothetical protein